jgi:hypothetical protein
MRRSAAALLAHQPPPPPPPVGLEAVRAAVEEAVRAVERKFAAVRAAVPSLVLAAPALLPARRALLSKTFSSTAPALSIPCASTLPRTRSGSDLQTLTAGAIQRGGGSADGGPAGAGRSEPLLSPRGVGPMLRRPHPHEGTGPPAVSMGAAASQGDSCCGGRVARGGGGGVRCVGLKPA